MVALTGLAFVIKLVLVVLGTALAPQGSGVAQDFASLCATSGSETSGSAAHDPALCQCGPICPHSCTTGPLLAHSSFVPKPVPPIMKIGAADPAHNTAPFAGANNKAIRAPPHSVI